MLVLTFSCRVVGGCVFGVGPMFLGFYTVQSVQGIIDLFYYKVKKIRDTTMSMYSNQGCIFS